MSLETVRFTMKVFQYTVFETQFPCFYFYGWPHAKTFLTVWKLVGFRPVSQIVLIKDRWGI